MEITVTVTKILDVQKFTSKNGVEYTKHQFVGVTSNEKFSKTICFSCMNDETWERMGIAANNQYNISFDLSSKEYNGRFFTEVNAWKAVNITPASQPQQQVQEQNQTTTQHSPNPYDDGMPF